MEPNYYDMMKGNIEWVTGTVGIEGERGNVNEFKRENPFDKDEFSKSSLKFWYLKSVVKETDVVKRFQTVLRKSPLKSYNYLQNCHCFTYDINFYITIVKLAS